ncbi:ATP-dependent DNA helicase chl1 [Lambiella insularis]|nr:ATP-dependent DNA helicase chl1 [Lambiella insularis]
MSDPSPAVRDFHHPFNPYGIQLDFMNAVYDCIENGQVGIFESPTGGEEPKWVLDHKKRERIAVAMREKQAREVRLAKVRAKELRQRQRLENGESCQKKTKIDHGITMGDVADEEASYVLDDYVSEEELVDRLTKDARLKSGISTTSFNMLDKLGMIVKPLDEGDDPQMTDNVKIFYCSRTHSQLTQFANEVRRVRIPSTLETVENNEKGHLAATPAIEEVKYLPLGSRKNLCINPLVKKLGTTASINERCLQLQQPSTPQNQRCEFLPKKANESLVHSFRDHILTTVYDIEDLGGLGRKIGICPYYASRASIKPSQVSMTELLCCVGPGAFYVPSNIKGHTLIDQQLITLPYPMLLQESARDALSISLKGHVVIIDEAHNLMDAISNLHSVTVSLSQFEQSRVQLSAYLQKFRNRLKGKNRIYVTQVARLIAALATYLRDKSAGCKPTDELVNINELMVGKGLDQINLYKLSHYLQESKLARKVDGYHIHVERVSESAPDRRKAAAPVLSHIQNFLATLTNPTKEGRFFFSSMVGDEVTLRYMLLDPTHSFRAIVRDARAVVLAGGTMSPVSGISTRTKIKLIPVQMEDYTRHLFTYLNPNRLKILSCGHVIPDENLLAWPITTGPNGLGFDFTYQGRNSLAMIDELGVCIIKLSRVIPHGLVVFFPSYGYLEQVCSRWKLADVNQASLWTELSIQKAVFRESKEVLSAEDTLRDYSNAISAGRGGLLLSVVGGKMSEGINFSDNLGRGIVVVGLPFPNIQSAEWKAKLEYIESTALSRGGDAAECKLVSRDFYENACMRAVNQSIGRAIRHQRDYATIIMLDRRYSTVRIQGKLPGWIKKSLAKDADKKPFKEILDSITGFFTAKQAGESIL